MCRRETTEGPQGTCTVHPVLAAEQNKLDRTHRDRRAGGSAATLNGRNSDGDGEGEVLYLLACLAEVATVKPLGLLGTGSEGASSASLAKADTDV